MALGRDCPAYPAFWDSFPILGPSEPLHGISRAASSHQSKPAFAHSVFRFLSAFSIPPCRHANCPPAGNPMYATAGSVRNISQPPSTRRTTSVPHLEQNPRKIKWPPSIVPGKLTIVVLLAHLQHQTLASKVLRMFSGILSQKCFAR